MVPRKGKPMTQQDEAYWAKEREKFEEVSRKLDEKKKPNPLLYALATVCLIVVVFLVFYGWNRSIDTFLPLIALFAVMGLIFGYFSRK